VAALEIGRSFVEIKGRWWIVLAASETKENRPDERPINEMLTPSIDRYLNQHRPVLARTDDPISALWLSSNDGAPMSYAGVEGLIKTTTLSTVGVNVSPHLFRASGASTAATRAGDNPHLASALLHHTDVSVTNAHYNRATSLTAADKLREIVRQGAVDGARSALETGVHASTSFRKERALARNTPAVAGERAIASDDPRGQFTSCPFGNFHVPLRTLARGR
jgi:integrase